MREAMSVSSLFLNSDPPYCLLCNSNEGMIVADLCFLRHSLGLCTGNACDGVFQIFRQRGVPSLLVSVPIHGFFLVLLLWYIMVVQTQCLKGLKLRVRP